jgi:hypothetical protein
MVNNAGATAVTAQMTSLRNSALSAEARLKPTPQAIGFAVANIEKCEPDIMRQDLHARCTGLHGVFEPEHGFSGEAIMDEDTQIDLGLDLNFDKCVARICIHGRTATVFPVESKALSGLQLDPI